MRKLIYIISACVMVVMVACGTSGKQTKLKHQQVVVQKDPLTPEQRRKYDYYFLEAVRMKQKAITMRLTSCISIAWIFIRHRGLPCMNSRSFICIWVRKEKENRL